jgi:hypothetical protein
MHKLNIRRLELAAHRKEMRRIALQWLGAFAEKAPATAKTAPLKVLGYLAQFRPRAIWGTKGKNGNLAGELKNEQEMRDYDTICEFFWRELFPKKGK